ncbi:Metallo-dependent phosphatase [Neoconidiobolus thromboides FSU 785]|nr:Metallo-dependent phosphatase [Neoconidiobolus thromboides FSU 785]
MIAIGDLHGDYSQAIKVLKMVDVIDQNNKWKGKNTTTLVQTGDVVDRGPDTIKLYKLLKRLRKEAEIEGGLVVPLLGNHELMNLMEDYRYVTEEDIQTFGDLTQRKLMFTEKGWIGRYLRGLNLTAKIEDTIFCHGGIHPTFAEYGNTALNIITKKELSEKTPNELWNVELFGGDGPAWYRGYALETETEICNVLKSALKKLGVKRMVVGHTVQSNGKIRTRCEGRVILIDVGISAAYGGYQAALVLSEFTASAIYPSGMQVLRVPNENEEDKDEL